MNRNIAAAFCLAILCACGGAEPGAGQEGPTTTNQQDAIGWRYLWVAIDSGEADPTFIHNFFECLLKYTNFTSWESNWSSGRQLQLASVRTVNHCSVVHQPWCSPNDASTVSCITNQTGWSLNDGDVVLYFPSTAVAGTGSGCNSYSGGCYDGRNHWNIPWGSIHVNFAASFSGTGSGCQTELASHEVYEASTDASSADCCNGQNGCSVSNHGFYGLNACGTTYYVQQLPPTPSNLAACTQLTSSCGSAICNTSCGCPSGDYCYANTRCCPSSYCTSGCPC